MLVVASNTNIREFAVYNVVWHVTVNLHKMPPWHCHEGSSEDYLNHVAWVTRCLNQLAILSVGEQQLDMSVPADQSAPYTLIKSTNQKQRNTDLVACIMVACFSCFQSTPKD